MITTRFAAEQGRDIFAVPGNATSRSSIGANRLIQDGAKMVLKPADLVSFVNEAREAWEARGNPNASMTFSTTCTGATTGANGAC